MSQQLKNITRTSKIFVRNNDVDKALRILKKKLLLEGVVKEVREKRHFTPPGEKRRLEAKAGRKRWLKKREQIEQRMVRAEQNAMRKNRNKNKKHVPRQDKNSNRPQHSNNTPRFKSK